MNKKLRIAGVGEVLFDAFPEGEEFGGAPANFACHCHTLGAEAFIVSCVGEDERGRLAKAFLDEHGADTTCLAVNADIETGVVNVTLDEAGKPEYEIKEGVAWDNIPLTAEMTALAPTLDAVCFGSLSQRNQLSRDSIEAFLAATAPDCLRVFDINIRQDFYNDEILLASLEVANALKLNDEELPLVANLIGATGSDEEQLKAVQARFGLKLAVLTCGAEGALMLSATDACHAPAGTGTIVSTVGAGDSFTAATIMGFLAGRPLAEINRHANEVAMYVCGQQGAVPKLPASFFEG